MKIRSLHCFKCVEFIQNRKDVRTVKASEQSLFESPAMKTSWCNSMSDVDFCIYWKSLLSKVFPLRSAAAPFPD